MKILFDMRPVQKALNRGIGYYCIGLIEGLAANPDVEMSYLADHWRAALPAGLPPGPVYFSDRLGYLEDYYDVYIVGNAFSTLYFRDAYEYLVPARVRERTGLVAALVYDMIPWLEQGNEFKRPTLRKKFFEIVSALKRFDHIFCISEATREDLIRYIEVPRSMTSVIYGSSNPGTSSRRPSYDFDSRANAVVYVGGSMPRKNVRASVEGFAEAYKSGRLPADSQYFLVFRPDDLSVLRAAIEETGVGDRVVATGFLADAALDELICRCKATVFPSLFEGLGMPVIESYRLDTPCFVGDNTSLRELAPPDCRFDASSVVGLADMFVAALTDREACIRSVEHGRAIAAELTWEKVGKKARGILASLLRARAASRRSERVFLRAADGEGLSLPPALEGALRAEAGRFAWVCEGQVREGQASGPSWLPRYSAEYLSRRATMMYPVADLVVLGDSHSCAALVGRCADRGGAAAPIALYLSAASYPRLLFALAGRDIGRLRALLFGAYGATVNGIEAIGSLDDLVRSGIACIAPIVGLAHPRAILARDDAVLEAIRRDLPVEARMKLRLVAVDDRLLYETVAKAVGDGA